MLQMALNAVVGLVYTPLMIRLLFTINLTISFPMSVFANIISANERFIFLKLLGMMKTVGSPLLTIPLLLMGKGSVAVVAVALLISLLVDTVLSKLGIVRRK